MERSSHDLQQWKIHLLLFQIDSARARLMCSNGARGRVLVLKDRSVNLENGGQRDPYEIAFENAGYTAHFLPVLSHKLVNLDKIARVITAEEEIQESFVVSQSSQEISTARSSDIDSSQKFAGVVFTSQRAVEAWAEAGKRVLASNTALKTTWQSIPFYAVGPATASALLRLDDRLRPPFSSILGADETGNAVKLASFIASQKSNGSNAPLLYLSGDKRKDTLESLLRERGIRLHEVQAYETFQSPTFEEDHRKAQENGPFAWIIFFSPSGAKMLLPLLRESDLAPSPSMAAIGPTTRDYLLSQKVQVAAMAESPNPTALLMAMSSNHTP